MTDERCDRDRVTAILTLKDAATPLPWRHECSDMCANQIEADDDEQAVASTWAPISLPDNDYSREENNAAYIVAACNAFPDVARRLLDALDTIDRLEGEKEALVRELYIETGIWRGQALNGGNESGDDR